MPARGALAVLALSIYAVSAAETAGIGLQRPVAAELHIATGTAGWVVTAYALGCALLGPPLALLCAHQDRRHILAAVMAGLAIAQAVGAITPDFPGLIATRVVAGACQGLFFGVATVTAVRLAPPGREGRALAAVSLGLTAALVSGAPLANAVGSALSWRAILWGLAAIAAASAGGLFALVPGGPVADGNRLAQLRVMGRREVRTALTATIVSIPGIFCAYTYLPALLHRVTGVSGIAITGALVLLGICAVTGTTIAGRLQDLGSATTQRLPLLVLAGSFTLLGLGASVPVLVFVACSLFGLSAFAIIPGLQGAVIRAASDAPLFASAANISAFNIANALGAGAGGALIDTGFGLRAPAIAAAIGTALAAVALISGASRPPKPHPHTSPSTPNAHQAA